MAKIIRSYNTIHNRRAVFRSTITKRFFISIAIILAAYGVFIGNRFFNLERYRYGIIGAITGTEKSTTELAAQGQSAGVIDSGVPQSSTVTQTGTSAGSSSGGNSSQSDPSAPCGNIQIPVGACNAIESIEKTGAKNNPYVAVDTTQLPDGTKFTIDRSSWSQFSKELGGANATGQYNDQTLKLSLTFTLSSGIWRVTSYTLN